MGAAGAMNAARDGVLRAVRRGLGRGPIDAAAARRLDARMAGSEDRLIPARAGGDAQARLDRFQTRAEAVSATVAHIGGLDALPAAVADYLASHNLPASVLASPDPLFDRAPWHRRPALEVRRGAHGKDDLVGLSRAWAALGETGSLVMAGGVDNPHMSSFVPETQIAVVFASRILGGFEDIWREARRDGLPRTLSFVTGPSRTGDIGLKIELGAHGPRRLHVIVVDEHQTAA